MVVNEFAVLVSVTDPAPSSANPEPPIAADCVTAPDAVTESVFEVAVTAESNATAPPTMVTGPLMLAVLATVMFAVLPVLPRVSPVN